MIELSNSQKDLLIKVLQSVDNLEVEEELEQLIYDLSYQPDFDNHFCKDIESRNDFKYVVEYLVCYDDESWIAEGYVYISEQVPINRVKTLAREYYAKVLDNCLRPYVDLLVYSIQVLP